jgi:YQGE family putative transporter
VTNAHFFQGLRDGTFIFVISVLVFISSGSELALGTFGVINSSLAFLGYSIIPRFIKPYNRKKAILLGSIILYLAVFLIVFDVTYPRLLIYGSVIAVAYPTILVPYISTTYDVIGRGWKAAEARIEYIVIREIFLNLGRIVSILTFIAAVTFFHEEQSIRVLLGIIGASYIGIFLFIRKISAPTPSA